MERDLLRQIGPLFLGSRLKRLGERLQADVLQVIAAAGLPVQPSQYPVLAALDQHGPLTIGALVDGLGVSQPAVTRTLARLAALGLITTGRLHRDQRHKTIALTDAGCALVRRSKRLVWPQVEAAVAEICDTLDAPLLPLLTQLEDALAARPLHKSPMAALQILEFTDALAGDFHDINAEWISTMFRLEQTDREVLENPRAKIIEPGGDILFVAAPDLGVIGACALQKTGDAQFELTKMGVRQSARGRKAGEFLLRAILRRARDKRVEKLYLLTNSACAPAIHLYEKLGFRHDPEIMREFGARYARSDVAMRYVA